MHLHFLQFPNTETRKGPFIRYIQYHGYWCAGDTMSQNISSHRIAVDQIKNQLAVHSNFAFINWFIHFIYSLINFVIYDFFHKDNNSTTFYSNSICVDWPV